MSRTPRIVPLREASGIGAGGKAEGLARLLALGFRVPPGFVVVDASRDTLPHGLADAYGALGEGPVAVRSSASDEDGSAASFAGQHETILDVQSFTGVEEAVLRCARSIDSAHASAYRASRGTGNEASMSVVVQRMVDARAAGVVFTADPVTSRRDRIVVDVVRGVGESLVSGHATPDHHLLDANARLVRSIAADVEEVLPPADVERVAREAAAIARAFGHPIDGEFAFDREGNLNWLQARPITTLAADPRELDSPSKPDHVYTRCNIGEMMPGAATPLTWSTSAKGIDHAMQRLYAEIGAHPRIEREPVYIVEWFGNLFIDLSELAKIGSAVVGASERDVTNSICGRPVAEVRELPKLPLAVRAKNGAAYLKRVFAHRASLDALDRLLREVRFDLDADARTIHASIDRMLPLLLEGYYHHLVASMISGVAASALVRALAGGREPTELDHATVAEYLAGAEGVESHDIALGIDRLVAAILEAGVADVVVSRGHEALRRWFEFDAPRIVRDSYRAYMDRHGHRCVREVEMREREWASDPTPILDAIASGVRARLRGRHAERSARRAEVPAKYAFLVRLGHDGVRSREGAKSKLVDLTARFKRAYRALAIAMVREGLLDDADLVYFLTHDELGRACREPDASWSKRARSRRDVHAIQMALDFPDVVVGEPEPISAPPKAGDRTITGKPVSRGVVRGRARVARTLEDARLVEPGEILIARITDVGWTPCFSTIAGLATDIGSAVSHGAVVAREYGLPALVDTRVGTTTFCTGDLVELDANRGVLRIVEAT